MEIFSWLHSIKVRRHWLVIILLIIAFALRTYNIYSHTIFLSDQGRDAIIMKRIIFLEDFPAIGPSMSVGQVFLGPLYYYLMSPFLFASFMNPLGLALGTIFLTLLGLASAYIVIRKTINPLTAFVFVALVTLSPVMVQFSRFAWNPNLLPVVSFFTLYFFWQYLAKRSRTYALLFGLTASVALQLHYLALLLFVPMGIYIACTLLPKCPLLPDNFMKNRWQFWKHMPIAIAGFIALQTPLILFDIKNRFLNTRNLISYLLHPEEDAIVSSLRDRLEQSLQWFIHHAFMVDITQKNAITVTVVLLVLCMFFFIRTTQRKQNKFLYLIVISTATYILLFGLMDRPRHEHYYMSIYWLFYLTLAWIVAELGTFFKHAKLIAIFSVLVVLAHSLHSYTFFTTEGNNQIQHAERVAKVLHEKISGKPFNIATWPITFTEDNYLYFLEVYGDSVARRERNEITEQMFVLCNSEPCSIINSPSWNISMFGPARIADRWKVEGITIYRLVHAKK